MTNILVSTAEEVCGTHRNPTVHKETWSSNAEVEGTYKKLLLHTRLQSRFNHVIGIYCQKVILDVNREQEACSGIELN
jgi:hypothetical protein